MAKPALTHKAILNLLAVRSIAKDAADGTGDTPEERKHAAEVEAGCDWLERLAADWAKRHGCDWPTEYKKPAKGTP